jgi:hypothetical protein
MSEQPKHDGKLGKHEVELWQEFVVIEEADGWLHDESEYVQLTAEQALSLLAWLEENKPVIEKLAEENKPSTD